MIEGRMSIYFVGGRIEQTIRFSRIGGMDISAFNDPNAQSLLATGIHVPGILDRHGRVGRVEASHVFMVQPLFTANKYFP